MCVCMCVCLLRETLSSYCVDGNKELSAVSVLVSPLSHTGTMTVLQTDDVLVTDAGITVTSTSSFGVGKNM